MGLVTYRAQIGQKSARQSLLVASCHRRSGGYELRRDHRHRTDRPHSNWIMPLTRKITSIDDQDRSSEERPLTMVGTREGREPTHRRYFSLGAVPPLASSPLRRPGSAPHPVRRCLRGRPPPTPIMSTRARAARRTCGSVLPSGHAHRGSTPRAPYRAVSHAVSGGPGVLGRGSRRICRNSRTPSR